MAKTTKYPSYFKQLTPSFLIDLYTVVFSKKYLGDIWDIDLFDFLSLLHQRTPYDLSWVNLEDPEDKETVNEVPVFIFNSDLSFLLPQSNTQFNTFVEGIVEYLLHTEECIVRRIASNPIFDSVELSVVTREVSEALKTMEYLEVYQRVGNDSAVVNALDFHVAMQVNKQYTNAAVNDAVIDIAARPLGIEY